MASAYFTLPSFVRAQKNRDDLEKKGVKDPVLNDADEKFLSNAASRKPATHIPTTKIADNGTTKETKQSDDVVVLPGKTEDRPQRTKNTLNELPSQEEAEAATKGFQAGALAQAEKDEKKTWSSYLPSLPTVKSNDDRSWKEFAQSYIPDLPALPASWSKSAKAEVVYKEDGTVDEEATKVKQEKEVSVLLDNLSLSAINNHAFSFSQESQKIYDRFVQVLKDVINGVPTAYDDMEKLMKEAGPTIEKQWKAMPPFVQTLVKALPAKLSTSFAPELLAAASEKPALEKDKKAKKKRSFKIPGLKGLVKKQGLAATILRNIVVFFETRFPFLVSTTNIAMSLSVFVLMFVFYYCWKRGREVRLAKEAQDGAEDDDDDEIDIEVTEDEDSQPADPKLDEDKKNT